MLYTPAGGSREASASFGSGAGRHAGHAKLAAACRMPDTGASSFAAKGCHFFHNIEDVGLQLLRSVCSHAEIELQVIGVALEGLAHTCSHGIPQGHLSGHAALPRRLL